MRLSTNEMNKEHIEGDLFPTLLIDSKIPSLKQLSVWL